MTDPESFETTLDQDLVRRAREAQERLGDATDRSRRAIEEVERFLLESGLRVRTWIPIASRRIRGGGDDRSLTFFLGYTDEGGAEEGSGWGIKLDIRPTDARGASPNIRPIAECGPEIRLRSLTHLKELVEKVVERAQVLADALEDRLGRVFKESSCPPSSS